MKTNKNSLNGYAEHDIRMYFTSKGSYLPFIDSNGRKRVGQVVGCGGSKVKYRAILLGKTDVTTRTYTKNIKDFKEFNYAPKYIKVDECVFYIYPRSIRTVAKAVTNETMSATQMINETNIRYNHALDYKMIWEYYWGEDHGDNNGTFTAEDGTVYIYGIKL